MIRLTPIQREVWNAIVDYVHADGKRFYASPDPARIGDVLIAPKYGEGIQHSTLKALEREGLIVVPDDDNNGFRLTEFGSQVIVEGRPL